jgi:hypothetical protein
MRWRAQPESPLRRKNRRSGPVTADIRNPDPSLRPHGQPLPQAAARRGLRPRAVPQRGGVEADRDALVGQPPGSSARRPAHVREEARVTDLEPAVCPARSRAQAASLQPEGRSGSSVHARRADRSGRPQRTQRRRLSSCRGRRRGVFERLPAADRARGARVLDAIERAPRPRAGRSRPSRARATRSYAIAWVTTGCFTRSSTPTTWCS